MKGREEFMGEMGLSVKNQNKCIVANGILKATENWKPKERYKLYKLR